MKLELEFLDEIDLKNIEEMYDEYTVNQIDKDNVMEIYNYLIDQGIYYASDIFVERLELFIQNSEDFIRKFEELKIEIGMEYIEKIGEDTGLLDKMY